MKSNSQALKAYTELRKKILSNQLAPGGRLKEDTWAAGLGVSRMAVREALTRLLGEQLVVPGERGGYFVNSLSPTDIHALRELREVLETGALRLLAKKITKAKIEKLEKICNDFSHMVAESYFAGACEADIKFHETLVSFAGNDKLLALYHNSHIPLFHKHLHSTHTQTTDYSLTDKEHRMIVQALKNGKPALAEQWLIKHFARGEALMTGSE